MVAFLFLNRKTMDSNLIPVKAILIEVFRRFSSVSPNKCGARPYISL
jgi:hypothetical protein